ncbi:MAG TPA: ORF6N domain-containing protein [Steroidobacteraceae bacterium]
MRHQVTNSASLYGVETRVLVQAVKRNIDRFPDDFMLQLTTQEWAALRSQSVILKPGRGQHLETSSKGAFAFSAQGKTDAVMERLKGKAAKLGANGILLEGVGDQAGGSVGTGFANATASGHSATAFGIGNSATLYHKKGNGLAIYVEPDQVASR